jgi:hypothetical protein
LCLDQLVSIPIQFINCIYIVYLIDSWLYFIIGLGLKLSSFANCQDILIFDCNKIYIVTSQFYCKSLSYNFNCS